MNHQNRFVFDLNLCVGCHACILACAVENSLEFGHTWRWVMPFNDTHRADLPGFFLSLACNHCMSPACLNQCPTGAFRKDSKTGAVLLDQDRCMGCRFCQWVCPFAAPRFDPQKRLMEKCHFCHSRLVNGDQPACVDLCPTGALTVTSSESKIMAASLPGFPESKLEPAISFVKLKRGRSHPVCTAVEDASLGGDRPNSPEINSTISLAREWPLIIFTWVTAVLVGLFSAQMVTDFVLDPLFFLASGLGALSLSAAHLGRKSRVFFAVRNWRRSWLSREVLGFGAFLALGTMGLWRDTDPNLMSHGAWIAGLVCLFSMDAVYAVIPKNTKNRTHSAQVLWIGFWVFAMFSQITWLLVGVFMVRAALYARRKRNAKINPQDPALSLSLLRSVFGFFVPTLLWCIDIFLPLAAVLSLIGDLLDRIEFYGELEPKSPTAQMALDFSRATGNPNQFCRDIIQ